MDGEATINRVGYTTIKRDEGVTDCGFLGQGRISRMMKEKRLVGDGQEHTGTAAGLSWVASNGGFSVVGAVVYLW